MTLYLRPEARPASWQMLNQNQQEAYDQIVKLMKESIKDVEKNSSYISGNTNEFFPWMSEDRSSRTVFLNGKRGTGKSTVLLSLMQGITESKKDLSGMNTADQLPKNKLIWLEPIDMEPVPNNLNMLAAILVRIQDAYQRLGGYHSESHRKSRQSKMFEPSPDFQDALWELQQLQSDVILAWEGNITSRAGQLDPDTYAVETLRAERARVLLNRRIAQVLEILAKELSKWEFDNPIFVLPIDDFDLNPTGCLDVLRLLRMISVPRLFTIVLGNIENTGIILNMKSLGELAQVGLSVSEINNISHLPYEVAKIAGSISANAMRKLLPPTQRVLLRPMTILETLNYRPLGSSNNEHRLYQRLSMCDVFFGEHIGVSRHTENNDDPGCEICGRYIKTLLGFLCVPGLKILSEPVKKSKSKTKGQIESKTISDTSKLVSNDPRDEFKEELLSEACYHGRHVLDTTPRRASDLWLAIELYNDHVELYKQKRDNKLIKEKEKEKEIEMKKLWQEGMHLITGICRRALLEDEVFRPEARRLILSKLAETTKGEWDLYGLPITTDSIYDGGHAIPLNQTNNNLELHSEGSDEPLLSSFRCILDVYCVKKWRFTATESEPSHKTEANFDPADLRQLTVDASAALVFLHDILVMGPEHFRLKSSRVMMENTKGNRLAVTKWTRGDIQVAKLWWPEPPCASFWGMDLFRNAWNHAIDIMLNQRVAPQDKANDWAKTMAYIWIAAGTALISDEHPKTLDKMHPNAADWKSLGIQLAALDPKSGSRQIRDKQIRTWLVRVACLIMPEYGIPDISDLYKKNNKLINFWSEYHRSIKNEREKIRENIIEDGLPNLAKQLFKSSPAGLGDDLTSMIKLY